MLKKAALVGGALVTLLNCGCGGSGLMQWAVGADVIMQATDLLHGYSAVL